MELEDKEKVWCPTCSLKKEAPYWWKIVREWINVSSMTWTEFMVQFNRKYFNFNSMWTQQMEFLNLKQGKMTVTEAVRKFEKLERMCPFLKLIEKERVLRMMDMFHPDIAIFAETDEQLTMVMECYEKALHAKFRLNQLQEEKSKKV